MFLVCRLFIGFGLGAAGTVSFVLLSEAVPDSKVRNRALIWLHVAFAFGIVAVAALAWLLHNSWRGLTLALALIGFAIFYGTVHTVEESPKWLFARKKYKFLAEVLERIALANGTVIAEGFAREDSLVVHYGEKKID